MLDFNKAPIEKSAEERQFDELNVEYTDKFGFPYVFNIGFPQTWEETLSDIRNCIETGVPQKQPDYIDGNVY